MKNKEISTTTQAILDFKAGIAFAEEWIPMGIQYPAPGFCTELQYCYMARHLHPAFAEPDEDEIIDVVTMSVAEIENAIASGELCDAKSISLVMKARIMGLLNNGR